MPENIKAEKKLSLTFAISVMSLSAPILYLIGYFYNEGFLTSFGLNSQFFPSSVQDHLVNSFFAFTQFIMWILASFKEHFYYFIAVAIAVFYLVLAIPCFVKHEKGIKTILRWDKVRVNFKHIAVPLLASVLSFLVPYIITAVLAVLVVIPYSAYWQGERDGLAAVEKFKGCDMGNLNDSDKCVFIRNSGNVVLSGMFVAKSLTHIAVWDGDRTEIYPLKDERVSIEYGKKKPNKE